MKGRHKVSEVLRVTDSAKVPGCNIDKGLKRKSGEFFRFIQSYFANYDFYTELCFVTFCILNGIELWSFVERNLLIGYRWLTVVTQVPFCDQVDL